MNEQTRRVSPLSFLEAVGLIILFLTVGVWCAAVITMAIMALARYMGGTIGTYLMAAGADRVMRRCLMGWAALFIVVLLKRAGWQGWKDCGFSADTREASGRPWWANVLLGISLGLIILGSLSVLTLWLDFRIVTPVTGGREAFRRAISFIGSGIIVALIEETVCRGMLFRVLARVWSAWPAALLISMLFALAHFISPDPQAFYGSSGLQTSINILISTYTATNRTPAVLLTFINLTLLGIVFCGFVVRTRTVWLGIGAHAALVWGVKFFHLWTAVAPEGRPTLWMGQRSDFMDSFTVTVLLVGLSAWAFSRLPRMDSMLCRQGICWHVANEAYPQVTAWLARYFETGVLKTGVLLKDDDGCRVMAEAGLVLKSYWPKKGWAGIRFAVRPSRVRRAFRLGRELAAGGMATPMPLAWTVRRQCGFRRAEYLLTTEVIGAEPLTNWLERRVSNPAVRVSVMTAYGRLMALFHRNGYSNRDFKHENVMCSVRDPGMLSVIDLDGVRCLGRITRRRAGRDLMRVGKSLALLGGDGEDDVRAFFDAYNAGVPPCLHRHAFPV